MPFENRRVAVDPDVPVETDSREQAAAREDPTVREDPSVPTTISTLTSTVRALATAITPNVLRSLLPPMQFGLSCVRLRTALNRPAHSRLLDRIHHIAVVRKHDQLPQQRARLERRVGSVWLVCAALIRTVGVVLRRLGAEQDLREEFAHLADLRYSL